MSLNDFEIIKQLGSGAFSTVSLVKRKSDNTFYALKKVELSKMKPNEKDNSLNEIRLLASVNHKNIIAYKESFYDESSNTLNIILEYADGGDLQCKISSHKKIKKYFNEKTIWSIFIQMVYGIKELHDRNIIHRDLKSANIFLMKNGICKLGDLNVSKVAKSGLLKTQTGTPYFASPEVWSGKPYGLKSDIWSLGCILYQMASLKMPFQGNSFKEVYNNTSKCKYQPIPHIYSKELNIIIKKLLQIDPDKRPNCQQILEDPIINNKLKSLFNTNSLNDGKKDLNKDVNKNDDDVNEIIKNMDNELKKEKNTKNYKNTSRLLKSLKNNNDDINDYNDINDINHINDLLPKNNGYKVYNNYRIFKKYDTNPSSSQEEKNKEKDNFLKYDNFNSSYNKKYYNKSNINKYKTINNNFLKQKTNLKKLSDKSDSVKSNNLESKLINKQNSLSYINNRSEGNSKNNNEKNIKKDKNIILNKKPINIPLLLIKNKEGKNNSIPKKCFSAKNRKKALSENKNTNFYNNKNINNKNLNNEQYKKITPLNTNINSNNLFNNNHKKGLNDILEFNKTYNAKKEESNTSENGIHFSYNKKLENKFHFNSHSKQKSYNSYNSNSLSKNKNDNKYSEEIYENTYNKQFRKSIPRGKNTKNGSNIAVNCLPIKPNIKVTNLFEESFSSKINTYIYNKFNNSLHDTLNKKELKRNDNSFHINNNKEKQKVFSFHKILSNNNFTQNRLNIDLNSLSKNKYTIQGEKLTLPSTKASESVSIKKNKNNSYNHKKILKKNINNINIFECNYNNNDLENNIYNYSNTSSNRINIYRQNSNINWNENNSINHNNKNNNMNKSNSLVSIDKTSIYNTQLNQIEHNKNINKFMEEFNNDNNIIHKKITIFKFDEFKKKRLKNNNNIKERKNKFLKFNHMPFINTSNKESDSIIRKQSEEPSSLKQKNNKNIDPTIKILINPIKIIEKRNFKRKLFQANPQVKLNILNKLNNTSYKNNNKDLVPSIQEEKN